MEAGQQRAEHDARAIPGVLRDALELQRVERGRLGAVEEVDEGVLVADHLQRGGAAIGGEAGPAVGEGDEIGAEVAQRRGVRGVRDQVGAHQGVEGVFTREGAQAGVVVGEALVVTEPELDAVEVGLLRRRQPIVAGDVGARRLGQLRVACDGLFAAERDREEALERG